MLSGLLLAAMMAGPVPCSVVRVLDGDTVQVTCAIWLGLHQETLVRIRGIDTPEKAPRAKCPAEAVLAEKASEFTKKALIPGQPVQLFQIDNDKFGGRVDAILHYDEPLAVGNSLGQRLISAGLARPYDGRKKSDWCVP